MRATTRINSNLLPILAICLTITTYFVLHRSDHHHRNDGMFSHLGESLTSRGLITFTVKYKQNIQDHDHNNNDNGNNHNTNHHQNHHKSINIQAASTTSDVALKEAIAAAVDYQLEGSLDTFSLIAVTEEYDENGNKNVEKSVVAITIDALVDGNVYVFRPNPNKPKKVLEVAAAGQERSQKVQPPQQQQQQPSSDNKRPPNANPASIDSVVITRKPATLPRVVVACLGTARYRYIAIEALKSASEHFGGDCLVSLHLLTDNISGVDPEFNVAFAPYREWPESGLSKFEDILGGLEDVIEKADYFFFIDGDVQFKEDVLLADVAADLTAVEHPFYPRHIMGFCTPDNPSGRGFCGYPYDRNPKSQIQVAEGSGKYFVKMEGDPKKKIDPYYIVRSNSWYIQSAFWGGKSGHVLPLLKDLKQRVAIDRTHHVYSQVVQDERYLNWYLWFHGNDSDTNIRILKPSYLYPFNDHGFGDHIRKQARPIIVHGTAKPGKMIKGEVEIRLHGKTICFDNFLKDQIGTYNCHHKSRKGGSQGFIWTAADNRLRVQWGKSDHPDAKTCVDATGLKPGDAVATGNKCEEGNKGQVWHYNQKTLTMMNEGTKLCLDPMRFDPKYSGTQMSSQHPVSMQPCGKSKGQQIELSYVSIEEALAARGQK